VLHALRARRVQGVQGARPVPELLSSSSARGRARSSTTRW
jgi:hypothetical protein